MLDSRGWVVPEISPPASRELDVDDAGCGDPAG